MTWAVLLGGLSGVATLLALGPLTARLEPARLDLSGPSRPVSQSGGRLRPRLRRSPRRQPDRLAEDLATQRMLETLARSLRAGRTLTEALVMLAPGDRPTSQRHLLHDTLMVAATAGTGPATVLEHAATVAADRVAARQERRSQAAQARLSATVLTWVPVGVAVLAVAGDGDVRDVMLTTPLGWVCLGGGLALSALGRRWITRLTEGRSP